MNRIKSTLVLLCSLAATAVCAETVQEARVKKLIEPRMGANIKVDSVTKTPYAGLYEIRTNGDIFYTDENADYIVVGKVIDTHTYKDLTKERVDQLAVINFADLPLDEAIKTVKGNGKRVMAIFEDPNCPYCKNLHKTLQDIDNVTVYTFLLNILSDDSAVKSRNIWCAADRSKAWNEWMVDGKPAATVATACPTPNDKVLALGKKLRIVGTPTVYFSDGTRTGSALDAKALEQKLASLK
ncbi:Thiol:disulfide interchange protein DsbC [Collimonas arenae]|uniref:Thiol:disulfide interchange protein n=1 Tax=Collimonas arenae TaxID=279058 RepID=A0A0A1FJW8_9BURK|nr:DsbC family protein [Collimonas arenae]AIY43959.1 Thiol:disulfide interchange protein DsbC [Collimonas arenae]